MWWILPVALAYVAYTTVSPRCHPAALTPVAPKGELNSTTAHFYFLFYLTTTLTFSTTEQNIYKMNFVALFSFIRVKKLKLPVWVLQHHYVVLLLPHVAAADALKVKSLIIIRLIFAWTCVMRVKLQIGSVQQQQGWLYSFFSPFCLQESDPGDGRPG